MMRGFLGRRLWRVPPSGPQVDGWPHLRRVSGPLNRSRADLEERIAK